MWHPEHCEMLHCAVLQHGTVQCLERCTGFSFPCIFYWVFFILPFPLVHVWFPWVPAVHLMRTMLGKVLFYSHSFVDTKGMRVAHISSSCFPDAWWCMRSQPLGSKSGLTVFYLSLLTLWNPNENPPLENSSVFDYSAGYATSGYNLVHGEEGERESGCFRAPVQSAPASDEGSE